MRTYADSSFLVKLLAPEAGSDRAVAEYRRLRLPRLFYLPLHALEVENALEQRAFRQRRSLPAGERGQVTREKTAAISRLNRMLERRLFMEATVDWDAAVARARALAQHHTASTGARSLDLLHIAFALELSCEVFLTTDVGQSLIATAEGMKVVNVSDEE